MTNYTFKSVQRAFKTLERNQPDGERVARRASTSDLQYSSDDDSDRTLARLDTRNKSRHGGGRRQARRPLEGEIDFFHLEMHKRIIIITDKMK